MREWEYRVISGWNKGDVAFEKILNELGSAGWEAIGIGHGGSRDGHETRIILKREVV